VYPNVYSDEEEEDFTNGNMSMPPPHAPMAIHQDRRQSATTNMSNISSEDIDMQSAGK